MTHLLDLCQAKSARQRHFPLVFLFAGMLEGSQGQVEHQSAVGRNGARVAGVVLGAVAQLVGDVDLPAVALVHVHEDGREAVDVGGILVGGGAVRGDGYERFD